MTPSFLQKIAIAPTRIAIVCTLAFTAVPRAMSEDAPTGDAKTLLDEAKRSQTDRKRAAMQKELDRLGEDAKKAKEEKDDLEKSMSKVGNTLAGTKSQIDQLAGRKKRVVQDLELLPVRIEAAKLKAEALSLLNTAHAKEMEALEKRNEELDLKAALTTAEIQRISGSDAPSAPDSREEKSDVGGTLRELRKKLEKARERSSLADNRAREALEVASRRLQQADAAAAKAEQKQAEIDIANDPHAPALAEPPKSKFKRAR